MFLIEPKFYVCLRRHADFPITRARTSTATVVTAVRNPNSIEMCILRVCNNIMTDTRINYLYRWLDERRATGVSRTISGRRIYHRTGLQAAWTCRKKEFHYEHEPRRQWCCLRETLYHAFLHLSSAFSKICKKNVSHSKAAHQNIPNTTHLPSSV